MKIDKKLVEQARKELQNPQRLVETRRAMALLGIPNSDQLPPGHDDPAAETVKNTSKRRNMSTTGPTKELPASPPHLLVFKVNDLQKDGHIYKEIS